MALSGQRSAVAHKNSEPGPGFRSGQSRVQDEELALVALLAAEDASAFRTLISRHLASVLATTRRMLKGDAEAEDIAQETMLRLWRSAGTIEVGPAGVLPWLRRTAVNLCLDRVRASKRFADTDVPEVPQKADQLSGMEDRDLAARVESEMGQLPERQRIAITLFHYEGMSQMEIAAALGLSDDAVELLLARARRSLRGRLEDEWRGLMADSR